jgi:hypothetical protein
MPKIFIAIMVLLYTNNTFAQCEVEISPDGPVNLCEGEFVELTTTVTAVELSVDQQQLLYLGGESARNLPGYSTWQSFTAGVTGDLVQIDQGFFNEMTGTATLNIFTGTGNGGTLLYSETVTISGTGNFWETFVIDTPVPITESEVYTFEIVPDLAGGLPDPYGVQVSGPADNYAGGRCEFDVTWDDVFKTYVSAPISYTWSTGATSSAIIVNEPGTYTVNINAGPGCSATDAVDVVITEVNTNVTVTDFTILTAEATDATYQWINCYDNEIIEDATSQTYFPDENSEFAVIVTQNGCTDTSECIYVQVESILTSTYADFKVVPNPATDNIQFQFDAGINPLSIVTFDIQGNVIQVPFNNNYQANLLTLAPGLYFSKINLANESFIIKWVKN